MNHPPASTRTSFTPQTFLSRIAEEARSFKRLVFHTPDIGPAVTDYDAYWKSRLSLDPGPLNPFQFERADWTSKRLSRGAVVLDVGCGDGGILAHLRETAGIVPVGADVSSYVLEILRKRDIEGVKLDLNAGGVDSLPEADHFLAFEVLEHVQNPEALLASLLRKSRRSVFFSVPNTGYFAYRLRLLLGRFPMQWRVHPGEHVRFWTLRDMKWWLDQLGWSEQATVHVYRGIPVLNRILPGLFGMGMIVEVVRKETE